MSNPERLADRPINFDFDTHLENAQENFCQNYKNPTIVGVVSAIAGGVIGGVGFWLAGAAICSFIGVAIAVTPLTITIAAIACTALFGLVGFVVAKGIQECCRCKSSNEAENQIEEKIELSSNKDLPSYSEK